MPAIGTAGKFQKLLIRQGADFIATFQVVDPETKLPINIVGYTIRSQVRKTVRSAAITVTFTCVVTDGAAGMYELRLTSSQTAAITAGEDRDSKDSQYVWDAELVSPGGSVSPLSWGAVSVHPEVTR